jgi:uncharacterized protein
MRSDIYSFLIALSGGIMLRKWLAALIFLFGVSISAYAAVADALYEVIIPCGSQTDLERQRLFKQGMKEVLNRISTESDLHRYPDIVNALDRAVDFIERYAYEDDKIRIQYNAALIRPLIHRTGQVVWGEHRPKVILWLAVEENQQRRLIGQETDRALQAKLLEMATRRGIPLVLPQMDLEDISAVSTNDIWGEFPSVLQQASQRYEAQAVLVGRLRSLGGNEWEASWQWLAGGTPLIWENSGDSIEGVLNSGFDRLNMQFKGHYATKKEGSLSQSMMIGILNLHSIRDFIRAESYLESLDLVKEVNLVQVLGERVVFEVIPRHPQSSQALMQAIGLDQHFVSLANDPDFRQVDMIYRWASLGD